MKKNVLAVVLALLFLSGCGGGDSWTPLAAGADGFRMAQESGVSRETFRGRAEFADFLDRAEPQFLIPGLNQGMTPQGISCSEQTDLVYITSYGSGDMPSAIAAVSLETGEREAEYFLFNVDATQHVGWAQTALQRDTGCSTVLAVAWSKICGHR